MSERVDIGERVVIVNRGHPWYGSAGEIVGRIASTGQWVVRLDSGHESGAVETELRLSRVLLQRRDEAEDPRR